MTAVGQEEAKYADTREGSSVWEKLRAIAGPLLSRDRRLKQAAEAYDEQASKAEEAAEEAVHEVDARAQRAMQEGGASGASAASPVDGVRAAVVEQKEFAGSHEGAQIGAPAAVAGDIGDPLVDDPDEAKAAFNMAVIDAVLSGFDFAIAVHQAAGLAKASMVKRAAQKAAERAIAKGGAGEAAKDARALEGAETRGAAAETAEILEAKVAEKAVRPPPKEITIGRQTFSPSYEGEAVKFLEDHPAYRDKFNRAVEKGLVPPKGGNGIVLSQEEGYAYKLKIKGDGGNYRINGRIEGNRIPWDKVTDHD